MPRVILDGYNLLLGEGRGADEAARDVLVREAARYRSGRDLEVVVVFDSRSLAGGHAKARPLAGVRVEFANGDADSAILAMVRASPTPRDLLVVTSDRRLAEQARDLGARSEDAASFRARSERRRGRRSTAPGTQPSPGPRTSASEVKEWLRVFAAKRPDDWEK